MYCENCGSKREEKALFCGKCGHKKHQESGSDSSQNTPKKRGKRGLTIGLSVAIAILFLAVGILVFLLLHSDDDITPPVTEEERLPNQYDVVNHEEVNNEEVSGEGVNGEERSDQNENGNDTFLDESHVNTTPLRAEDYVRLEFYTEFGWITSISPNGKFAIICEGGGFISILEREEGAFRYLKYLEGVPEGWHLRDDGSIGWSHCGEKFAFSMINSVTNFMNSDIFVCNIRAGTIENITGIEGEKTRIDFSEGAEGFIYLDFLPVWASDDQGIYFSRVGYHSGEWISSLSFVNVGTGEVETRLNFDMEEGIFIYPMLIYRDGVLFYDLSSGAIDGACGIYKYMDGEEILLVRRGREEGSLIHLLDVSPNGRKMLYMCRYHEVNFGHFTQFFLMNVDEPNQKQELQTVSPNRRIRGLFFSPDGTTIMQIEIDRESNQSYVYIRDILDPTGTPNLIYVRECSYDHFFGWSYYYARKGVLGRQAPPTWLPEGYLFMNGNEPRSYRIIMTADE